MQFIYPEFLAALVLIAIPIIIHLFNFRRYKKIPFTNVRFLQELKEETSSRSRLKHLLVLFSRILAIASLVFAFAMPFIPIGNSTKNSNEKAISIYIDNSFSMELQSTEGSLLYEAKEKAKEIVRAYKPTDKFLLLTNDFKSVHQRAMNKEDIFEAIDELKVSSSVRKISDVISRQQESLKNSKADVMLSYLISDFQKTTSDLDAAVIDSNVNISIVPVYAPKINNLYIDSVWFTKPVVQLGQPSEINIVVKNISDKTIENVPLKVTINGVQKSIASLNVAPQNIATTKMSFTITQAGWQDAEIAINDYPITFDDTYYYSFEVKEKISALCITEKRQNKFINAAYNTDNFIELTNIDVNRIDYSLLPNYSLVICSGLNRISSGLSSELSKFVENGGTLMLYPDSVIDNNSYNLLLNSIGADNITGIDTTNNKVGSLELNHELFADVFENIPQNIDLPWTNNHHSIKLASNSLAIQLMRLENGEPFLLQYNFGKGKSYIFTVALKNSQTYFPKHGLFAPIMYRAALLSENSKSLIYNLGNVPVVEIKKTNISGEEVFHLSNKNKNFDVIPEHQSSPSGINIYIRNQVDEAGNYKLTYRNNLASFISLNYNRKESNLIAFDADALKDLIGASELNNIKVIDIGASDLTNTIKKDSEGIKLWKLFIILALLFLLAEVLLLRFMR